jgi:NADH-quinone oxidoreductase subunit M
MIQLAALAQTTPVGTTPGGEFPTLLLSSIVWVPSIAAIAILFFPGRTDLDKDRMRTVAVAGVGLALALAVVMWYGFREQFSQFAYDENHPWIKAVGAAYHLGVDGVSMPLVLLTTLLFLVALLASWRERERLKEYLVLLLLAQTAITGVFASQDYLLLVGFWAMALVALTLLIAGWGGRRRVAAAWRFFGFTMGAWALVVLAVAIMHFKAIAPTFDVQTLHDQVFRGTIGGLLLWLTVAAFGITLAAVPLHGWFLDTVSEATTPVAMLVAGLVVKLGAYGLIRVSLGQFPEALHHVSTAIMVIGLVGVLWGGLSALGQDNAKRLVAALTVSQMGLVFLAVSSGRQVALDGALLLLFAHGLIVALLLGVVGLVAERAGTASLSGLGGLAARMPRGAVLGVVGALAALGMPGFVGFTGQMMLLMGSYPSHRTGTMVAVLGLLLGAAALLTMVQRLFFGSLAEAHARIRDAGTLEIGYASGLVFVLVLLGLLPALLIDNINSGVLSLMLRGGA